MRAPRNRHMEDRPREGKEPPLRLLPDCAGYLPLIFTSLNTG
jgi:hypothetical protein